jgi:hypothetical protein
MTFENWIDYFNNEILPEYLKAPQPFGASLNIASKKINLLFSSPDLANHFTLALKHNCSSEGSDPDLTIHVWQRSDLTTEPLPYSKYQGQGQTGCNKLYRIDANSISIFHPPKKLAFYILNDIVDRHDWIFATPFRNIFHWFFHHHNIHLIHGAVVGLSSNSILLTNKSGSGKSTTTMKCLEAGLDYLSDDFVGISSKTLSAYSFYNSLKLSPSNPFFNSELRNHVWNNRRLKQEKAIIFTNNLYPEQIKKESTLKAVVVPQLADHQNTRVSKIRSSEALLAILPTTLGLNWHLSNEHGAAIKKIVSELPCFRLTLGPNDQEIISAIKDILAASS